MSQLGGTEKEVTEDTDENLALQVCCSLPYRTNRHPGSLVPRGYGQVTTSELCESWGTLGFKEYSGTGEGKGQD